MAGVEIDDAELVELAGERAFARGAAYARQGRVKLEEISTERVRATVKGTERYRVEIDDVDSDLAWTCECPVAARGEFCKHAVATVIAARTPDSAGGRHDDEETDLREFLRAQPQERLANWLLDLAADDSAIDKRLRLHRAAADPAALKKVLGSLLRGRTFMDWRAATAFAHSLDAAIDSMADACKTTPERGLEICEWALPKLFARYAEADDSSGAIGDRVHALADLYCETLRLYPPPDDAARGRRFLDLQRVDQWGFLGVAKFWPLLGPQTQRAYGDAVEAEFAALPKAEPNDRGRWSREFPVVSRMEDLAAARGDVDLLIRVIARDLSSGHAYVRIVEACRRANRSREATQWAERGYRHHPEWRGMRALLAEQYLSDGMDAEALELCWQDFRADPAPETWRRLKKYAAQRWPDYRTRALTHVEQDEPAIGDGRRDVSGRVELLLADGDVASACELAEREAVSPPLLETLAAAAAKQHPHAAAGFLRRAVDATLPRLDARHYASAVEKISTVHELAPGADTDHWLSELRQRYRARRKLMALLDERLRASPKALKDRSATRTKR